MNWLKKHWLIIFILVISLFLRLYRIGATMTFLEDEGRDLLIVKRMIDTGRPVLLGPQTSTGNMYLGPLYYYFITPSLFLSRMNPVGPAIFIALTGVLTVYLLYYLGKKWFSPNAGYLAALMFGVLPFSVMVNRASWNPNLVPLVSSLMLIIYDKLIYQKSNFKTWLLYGILVGVMIQLHYMALVYVGILSLSIAWNKRAELKQVLRGALVAFVGVMIMLLPFIIFEVRNDWVNTKALTTFMLARKERNIRYDLPVWLWWDKVSKTSYRLIGNTLVGSELGPQPATPYVVFSFVALILVLSYLAVRKKSSIYLNLMITFLATMSIIGIYQESIHMHYIEFALPLVILLVAGLYKYRPRVLTSLGLSIILILGMVRTWGYINSGETHQVEKAKAVTSYIAQKAQNRPYNLVSSPKTNTSPYQYFAFINNHPPSNTAQNLVYMICQDAVCSKDDIESSLIFIHGPSHPSIIEYVGHPLAAYVVEKRKIISIEHVSYGIWVAEIMLE